MKICKNILFLTSIALAPSVDAYDLNTVIRIDAEVPTHLRPMAIAYIQEFESNLDEFHSPLTLDNMQEMCHAVNDTPTCSEIPEEQRLVCNEIGVSRLSITTQESTGFIRGIIDYSAETLQSIPEVIGAGRFLYNEFSHRYRERRQAGLNTSISLGSTIGEMVREMGGDMINHHQQQMATLHCLNPEYRSAFFGKLTPEMASTVFSGGAGGAIGVANRASRIVSGTRLSRLEEGLRLRELRAAEAGLNEMNPNWEMASTAVHRRIERHERQFRRIIARRRHNHTRHNRPPLPSALKHMAKGDHYAIQLYKDADFLKTNEGQAMLNRAYPRLNQVANEGHFGDHRRIHWPDDLDTPHPKIEELRYRNGTRIYYYTRHLDGDPSFVVLEIGNKNTQVGDIGNAINNYDKIEKSIENMRESIRN